MKLQAVSWWHLLVIQLLEDLPLVEDGADASLGEDACLGHLLHCKQLLVLLALDLPDLPEAALPNRIVILEIRLGHRLLCYLYIGLERNRVTCEVLCF